MEFLEEVDISLHLANTGIETYFPLGTTGRFQFRIDSRIYNGSSHYSQAGAICSKGTDTYVIKICIVRIEIEERRHLVGNTKTTADTQLVKEIVVFLSQESEFSIGTWFYDKDTTLT